jgi:ABC-type transport system substrate-binding protein
MPGFAPRKPIAYDTEAARRLLAEAGAAGTAPFDFWYTDSDPRWERLVVSIERDLRAAGFSPRLKKTNLAVLYTGMQTRRTAACAYLGWTQDYPDPSNFLDVLFSGARIQDSGGNNFSYYSNPEVDRRLAEADRVVVPEERYGRYREIEDLVLGDAPAIPLLHAAVPVLVSTRVGGVRPHPVWMLRPERWTIAESPRK